MEARLQPLVLKPHRRPRTRSILTFRGIEAFNRYLGHTATTLHLRVVNRCPTTRELLRRTNRSKQLGAGDTICI